MKHLEKILVATVFTGMFLLFTLSATGYIGSTPKVGAKYVSRYDTSTNNVVTNVVRSVEKGWVSFTNNTGRVDMKLRDFRITYTKAE